jgi:hypothetical protein
MLCVLCNRLGERHIEYYGDDPDAAAKAKAELDKAAAYPHRPWVSEVVVLVDLDTADEAAHRMVAEATRGLPVLQDAGYGTWRDNPNTAR